MLCYTNDDRNIKITRTINISDWYFKRVIFLSCDRLTVKDFHASLRVEIVDDRAIVPQPLVRVAGGLERFNNLV
ncbi:MAG: DUF1830 domain-containing protein [Phormidesmis sp. CAN_BIN36]|nr:DUF1830 domain-containing protein [Phormidesmis sp. CAN_BIN36]